jgi:hypothetical protein
VHPDADELGRVYDTDLPSLPIGPALAGNASVAAAGGATMAAVGDRGAAYVANLEQRAMPGGSPISET